MQATSLAICPESNRCMRIHYGLRFGATKGLVSLPCRLFFSKHVSRRPSAAMLPSSGTRNVAPSPLTSRISAECILSLRSRSAKAMVTPLDSANAFASTDREPATKITVYALPRSSFHLDETVMPADKAYIDIVRRPAHGNCRTSRLWKGSPF